MQRLVNFKEHSSCIILVNTSFTYILMYTDDFISFPLVPLSSNVASVYVRCQEACWTTNSNTTLIFVSWCRYCPATTIMITLSKIEYSASQPNLHLSKSAPESGATAIKNELEITTEALKCWFTLSSDRLKSNLTLEGDCHVRPQNPSVQPGYIYINSSTHTERWWYILLQYVTKHKVLYSC